MSADVIERLAKGGAERDQQLAGRRSRSNPAETSAGGKGQKESGAIAD